MKASLKFLSILLCLSISISSFTQINPGNALDFDGVNDYINMPNGVYFNGNFTIESWVYVRNYNSSSRLIDFGNGESSDNIIIQLSDLTTGKLEANVFNGATNYYCYSSVPIPKNSWTHIAGVLNNGTFILYMNGIEVGRKTGFPVPNNIIRNNCYIGRSNWAADEYTNATFDEFRIWSIARTQTQIIENMHNGLAGNETGLDVYFTFNQSFGNDVLDVAGPTYSDGDLRNMDQNTDWINSTSLIQPLLVPPSNITETSFTINWEPIEDAVYYLDVTTSPNFDTIDILDNVNVGTDIFYDVTSLDPGTEYFYRVRSETMKLSGNSLTGSIMTNGVSPSKAINFPGSYDWLELTDFEVPDTFSIDFWINPNNPGGPDYIIGKHSYTGSNLFLLGYNATGMHVSIRSHTEYINDEHIFTGWNHFAFVFKKSGASTTDVEVYKNGEIIHNWVFNSIFGDLTGKPWCIGQEWDTSPSDFFDGQLDELRFWGKALTHNDIKAKLHEELSGTEDDLIAYYDFNDIAGFIVQDHSQNDNHGKIINSNNENNWIESDAVIIPTARAATDVSRTGFTANWDAVPDAVSYTLYVSNQEDFSVQIDSFTLASNSLSIGPLAPDQTFFYKVKCQTQKTSIFSNIIEVATLIIPPGNSLAFDGTDDYGSNTNAYVIPNSGDFTVSVWAKHNSSQTGECIILYQDGWGDNRFYIGMALNGEIQIGSDWEETGVQFPDDDKWHHYAVVKTDENPLLYLDGELVAVHTAIIDNPARNDFFLGSNDDPSDFFDGSIDEIQVWDVALSQEEIIENMHKPLNGDEPGLISYYNFNETSGNILHDHGSNAFDVTLYNMLDEDWEPSMAVIPPVARRASNIGLTSFTANWDSIPGAQKYYIEVAEDINFTNIVLYDSTTVNYYDVSGLSLSQNKHYYHVRSLAKKLSDYSNDIVVFKTSGKVLDFDGVNDYVLSPEFANPTDELTIECWAKSNTEFWSAGSMLISKRDAFILHPYSGSKNIRFYAHINGTWRAVLFSGDIDLTEWHHYAGTFDGDTLKLLIDGEIVGTAVYPGTISANATGSMKIGRDDNSAYYFNGKIDEVRLWNVEKTPDELIASMHNELIGDEDDLVLYYNFNHENINYVADISGNGLVGALINMDPTNDWTFSRAVIMPFTRKETNLTNDSFTANWDIVPNAQKYYIEISDMSDFSNILVYDSTTVNYYDTPVLDIAPGFYYYRVSAFTHRLSEWSNTRVVVKTPGNALALDGVNDYVNFPAGQYFVGDFTVETWINRNHNTSYPRIFDATTATHDSYVLFHVASNHTFLLALKDTGGVDTRVQSTIPLPEDEWVHIAASLSGDTGRLYVNGKEVDMNTGLEPVCEMDRLFAIGCRPSDATRFLQGKLDEFRVWNYVRTEEQLFDNMHKVLSGKEEGLEMYFNFDNENTIILPDNSTNFNQGTLVNMDPATDWEESQAVIRPFIRKSSDITLTSFNVHWDSIPNAVEYLVEVCDKPDFLSLIANESVDTNLYNATGLLQGQTYYVRVKAVTFKESDYSNTLQVLTRMEVPGNSLSFNGTNQYVEANEVCGANYRQGLTVEAWINSDCYTGNRVIFAFNTATGGNYNLLIQSGNNLTSYDGSYDVATNVIQDTTWTHVAMVIEPYNNCFLYVNGEEVLTFTTAQFPKGGRFSIGQEWDVGTPSQFFGGEIDEARVWNTVRTQQQLLDNMHNTLNGDEQGLVAYYSFDMIEGDVLADHTQNEFNGNLINMSDTDWQPSMGIIQPTAREATEVTYNSFVANWDTVSYFTDYNLEMSTDPTFVVIDSSRTVVDDNNYEFINLKDETTYYYRLKYDRDTLEAYSNVIEAFVAARKPVIVHDSIFEICDYDTMYIHTNFMKNNTYQWFKDYTVLPADTLPDLRIDTSGYYHFMAIDTINVDTAWSDTLYFEVWTSLFGVDFIADKDTMLTPDPGPGTFGITYSNLTAVINNKIYLWMFGDDSISTEYAPFHEYLYNGEYGVSLMVTDTLTTCMQTHTKNNYIYLDGGYDKLGNQLMETNLAICPEDSARLECMDNTADTYQWYYNSSGLPISGATNRAYYAKPTISPEEYFCVLGITALNSTVESEVASVSVYELDIPEIIVHDTLRVCSNDTSVMLEAGSSYMNYSWSTGDNSDVIYIDTIGTYWFAGVTSEGCNTDTTYVVIEEEAISLSQICMVSIDLETGNNMVVWENNPDQRIGEYLVYRAESAEPSGYLEIGNLAQNEVGVFVDPYGEQTSFPEVYKMTMRDTCLNESLLEDADAHRPIFLTYSGIDGGTGGMILEWQYYEINGVEKDFSRYIILRGIDSLNLYAIDTVLDANGPIYVDDSPIAMNNDVWYRVMGEWTDTCAPASHLKANNGPFSRALSNMEDNRQQGQNPDYLREFASQKLRIYPNPATDMATLIIPNQDSRFVLNVYDQLGRLVTQEDNITGSEYIYECSDLPAGVYILELKGNEVSRGRLIIE